jgi:hypothetical protein
MVLEFHCTVLMLLQISDKAKKQISTQTAQYAHLQALLASH